MLQSLTISNYILIGSLETRFPEGLVIISGETGAGKSILLGALSLVLGAKAESSMVGPAGDNCVVEATFGTDETIRGILREADLPYEGESLTLRRTVARSGRSRSFANDEPVSVSVLQELSTRLVDIHSQHQTLLLADARFRLQALDLWAGAGETSQECALTWNALLEAKRQLSALQERFSNAQKEQEYHSARWEKLSQAQLLPGELDALEAEHKQLSHAGEIKELLCAAENLLAPEEEQTPSSQLHQAARLLEKAGRFIPSLEPLAGRLESARVELEDIAQEVRSAGERTEVSPQRLQQVEERISLLYGLLQKHGCTSVEELIAERDRLEGLVLDATQLGGELQKASARVEELRQRHAALCEKLHQLRGKAVPGFSEAVQQQLRQLELEHALFRASLEQGPAGPDGSDAVRFLFSATGAEPADVGKTASGGELSRIMLSLKSVMARFTQMPTLVFDEIDAGVSGSTADKMGSLVCEMGTRMQVFAITHLPQVAAKGNAHYLVRKTDGSTSVQILDHEGRVQELARMLSGATITPAAIANAKSLLTI